MCMQQNTASSARNLVHSYNWEDKPSKDDSSSRHAGSLHALLRTSLSKEPTLTGRCTSRRLTTLTVSSSRLPLGRRGPPLRTIRAWFAQGGITAAQAVAAAAAKQRLCCWGRCSTLQVLCQGLPM